MSSFSHPHPPRNALIVCTQRIGDVLLSTPIAHSLKSAWPDTTIDYLVLPGTESILEGNPEIQKILSFPQRAGLWEKGRQFVSIWQRYDLAIAATPTDRARLFARAAAPYAIGFTTQEESKSLKRRLLNVAVPFDNSFTHTVSMGLQLVEQLNIPSLPTVQVPACSDQKWKARRHELGISNKPYVVIHPYPKFRYKMWRRDKWIGLIDWLHRQELCVFLTGSNDLTEIAYIEEIVSNSSTKCQSLAGKLSLAETAGLLRHAQLYIGPDTAVTHLAAACGTPTIALFGPSNPMKWGPWPSDRTNLSSPWEMRGSERCGNVYLLQGERDCVPCFVEGCDKNIFSDSHCLLEINIERLIAISQIMLDFQFKH